MVHSTWPSRAIWHMHAPAFNKWHQKKKKMTLHILTHGAMRGCGLTSWVVCINDKLHDIRKRNVTIRSEVWTANICSLGFRNIREWVTLWGLILQSLSVPGNRHVDSYASCKLIVICPYCQPLASLIDRDMCPKPCSCSLGWSMETGNSRWLGRNGKGIPARPVLNSNHLFPNINRFIRT